MDDGAHVVRVVEEGHRAEVNLVVMISVLSNKLQVKVAIHRHVLHVTISLRKHVQGGSIRIEHIALKQEDVSILRICHPILSKSEYVHVA